MDWDELEKYAFGYLQMTKREFEIETPREFTNRLGGFLEVKDQEYKTQAELNRSLMYMMVLTSFANKSAKGKTAQQLFPLAWDKPEKQDVTIKTQDALAIWDRIDGKV